MKIQNGWEKTLIYCPVLEKEIFGVYCYKICLVACREAQSSLVDETIQTNEEMEAKCRACEYFNRISNRTDKEFGEFLNFERLFYRLQYIEESRLPGPTNRFFELRYCPVLKREIIGCYCVEVSDVIWEQVHSDNIGDDIGDMETAKQLCETCKNKIAQYRKESE